jgi:GIY-YIG catalytic domain
MWPREVFDERAGNQILAGTLDFLIKNKGVYVLFRNEEPHYVGKTNQPLYRRLWNHANQPRDKYYHFWTHFSAFAIENPSHVVSWKAF